MFDINHCLAICCLYYMPIIANVGGPSDSMKLVHGECWLLDVLVALITVNTDQHLYIFQTDDNGSGEPLNIIRELEVLCG